MNATPESHVAGRKAADEEIRKTTNVLFAFAGLGSLALLYGDLAEMGVAIAVAVLAALVRFKRSRVAAALLTVIAGCFLVGFVKAPRGIQSWSETLHAGFLVVVVLVLAMSALRATWRYHRV